MATVRSFEVLFCECNAVGTCTTAKNHTLKWLTKFYNY